MCTVTVTVCEERSSVRTNRGPLPPPPRFHLFVKWKCEKCGCSRSADLWSLAGWCCVHFSPTQVSHSDQKGRTVTDIKRHRILCHDLQASMVYFSWLVNSKLKELNKNMHVLIGVIFCGMAVHQNLFFRLRGLGLYLSTGVAWND